MAQQVVLSEDYMSTVSEDHDGNFTQVERRRKKEKRKAERVPESDSEPASSRENDPLQILMAKKKKRKEQKSSSSAEETAKEDKTHLRSLKEKSSVAFNRLLNLVAGSELESSLIRKILSAATEMKELMNEALIRNSKLEGKIECMRTDFIENTERMAKTVERKIQEAVPPKKPLTYAERVGVKAKNVTPSIVREPRNLVTIFPGKNEELKSSDAVKEAVRKLVSPQAEGIGIRNVRKIHNNGILIETDKRGDLDTLMKNEKLKEAGMEVGLPSKRQPRVIVFGVPRPTNDEKALKELLSHNFEGEELEKISAASKVAFKTGDKTKDKCNLVIEVTKEGRELLKRRERLYVGWECCRFQDYVVPTRCYKCQSYGHITKHCKAEKETCGHCGADGHSHKDCKSKEKPAVCINCKRAGKPSNHSIKDRDCFAYRAATQVVISRTDYGQ